MTGRFPSYRTAVPVYQPDGTIRYVHAPTGTADTGRTTPDRRTGDRVSRKGHETRKRRALLPSVRVNLETA